MCYKLNKMFDKPPFLKRLFGKKSKDVNSCIGANCGSKSSTGINWARIKKPKPDKSDKIKKKDPVDKKFTNVRFMDSHPKSWIQTK